ncbi:MAG TPA: methyltransferase domain-containing protein [Verrucomicrobiae bacterium]|nr:methyltransferase domain-containing protein [Verrucomicrobiae bacterium]
MKRIVEPELLDELPADDPRAVRSRLDLRRVNTWMRNHGTMASVLQSHRNGGVPGHLTELGAGDGHFLLRVARRLYPNWPGLNVTLLDRQPVVSAETTSAFEKLGWQVTTVMADVFDWDPASTEMVTANLFLHHFTDARLAELFQKISGHTRLFVAIEPRRFSSPFLCSQLLRLIGCSFVTRHDAAASIRAGFLGGEISALWPDGTNWQLTEHRAGLFSHLFVARKIS